MQATEPETRLRSTSQKEPESVENCITLALDLLVNITHGSSPLLGDLVFEKWATSDVAAGYIAELPHGRCEPL